MIKKQKIGDFVIYLEECPECHSDRKVNNDKLKAVGGISAAAIITGAIFGGPIVGVAAVIGVVKLVSAGTLAAGLGVKILQANYKILKEVNKIPLFECPKCKCTKIFE